jgi:hypothetical protein
MKEDTMDLEQQIIRCRRIASMMTDEEIRESLEALAAEYESRLPKRGEGFMLQPRAGDRGRQSSPGR